MSLLRKIKRALGMKPPAIDWKKRIETAANTAHTLSLSPVLLDSTLAPKHRGRMDAPDQHFGGHTLYCADVACRTMLHVNDTHGGVCAVAAQSLGWKDWHNGGWRCKPCSETELARQEGAPR